jgi:sporulation protein YlmC with PRC-barrel domain
MVSRLRGIGIVTDRGMQIGKLQDILVDEGTGKLASLVVKVISKEVFGNLTPDRQGNALVPFNAVLAIRDCIVLNERALAVQQLKSAPTTSPFSASQSP